MAVNPMQRKVRNSFLLGMFVTLIIAGIAIGILVWQMSLMNKKEQQVVANSKTMYMLTTDVKSGNVIETTYLKKVNVETTIANSEIVTPGDLTIENEDGGESKISTVAKVDLPKGSFLTQSVITTVDEKITDDLRIEEYNMISLPTDLSKNDYIDIRILFPNGQSYIVVAKKRVIQSTANTIFLKMTETELLTINNAMVEAWMTEGAALYAVKYDEPGMQAAAVPNYPVSREVLAVINGDPNIVEKAKNALWARYDTEAQNNRVTINGVLSNNMAEATEKISEGLKTKIQTQQSERNRYIETLGTGADY